MTARYDVQALRRFASGCLLRLGADQEEADILADGLAEGQLRSVIYSNQGFVRVAVYARRVRAGGLRVRAPMRVVQEGPATALFDGANGFGQVAATRAMRIAIEKAKSAGAGAVGVVNSNHFGQASYYGMMAAREGCIGVAVTNASPEIPVSGGAEPMIGTNPWGIAAPTAGDPFVLDLSNAAAGRGAIRHRALRGESVPHGWALDAEGRPTTEPAAALEGLVAPMGGYKGVAITVMMDVLAGVLTGAAFGAAVGSPYEAARPQRVGHFMLAVDISRFIAPETFHERMRSLAGELRDGRRAPGIERLFVPGEPELERRTTAMAEGCELRPEVVGDLESLGAELGVDFPRPLSASC
jgi:LDH2 family malate/lactate/ureidoglycolate dehydrogenase